MHLFISKIMGYNIGGSICLIRTDKKGVGIMSGIDYSSLFGKTSGLAGMLGDYSSIRSGSYGKLMKSYYASELGSVNSKASSSGRSNTLDKILEERKNPKVSKEVSQANSKLNSSVSNLKDSLGTLQNADTFKDTENGTDARTKVENALKSYVNAYNDSVTAGKKSTNLNMTSNVAGAIEATKANKDALAEIGISVNNDGTLSLDTKKLKDVDLDTVKDAFDGSKALSYGSAVASRLNRISTTAASVTTTDANKSTVAAISDSKSLTESISKLKGSELYSSKTDADGNKVSGRDGVAAEVGKFIDYYNSTIKSAKNSGVSGVASNLNALTQKTAQNSKDLAEIGISIGSDGKLSLNKNVFNGADEDAIKNTLTNYAKEIETNASLINYYSTTQNNAMSGYNANGTYNTNTADIMSTLVGQV